MLLLDQIIENAQMYQAVSALDCGVMVTDDEGIIVKWIPPKTFHFPATAGSKTPPGGAVDICLKTGKEVTKVLPKELWGVPTKVISVPIFDNGKIVGIIATGTSLSLQSQLQESAHIIAAAAQQLSATTGELASTATSLASALGSLQESGEEIMSEIQKTNSILELVNNVAANSNLLGLNAAIEAARAGEHGRGFAVVAQEIRKMADSSVQSITDIKTILQGIRKATISTLTTISDTTQLSERQAAATEEISASMQQLADSAVEVGKVAEQI